jgi:cytoskeleton protein RodZ
MSEDPQAIGQRLKAERKRRGISTQKIANGMHLDEWVIEALEAGDHQRIGPTVYARGHLKKYASMLGVSLAAPAADPPVAGSPVAAPPVVGLLAHPGGAYPGGAYPGGAYPPPVVRLDAPPNHSVWPRIGAVAAVAILAGGFFWWRAAQRFAPVPAPRASRALGSTGTSADHEPVAAAGAESGNSEDESAAAMAVARPPAVATPAAASAAADLTPGVGKARLRLSFSADSWVSIRDYSGKRIFEGDGRANSVKTFAGMAPFRVVLRSASGVQLQLNDRAVAIGRQFISGDEARFVAGADGVLRRDPPANVPQTAAVSPHD